MAAIPTQPTNMKPHFHLSRPDCLLLISQLVVTGICIAVMALRGPKVPVVLVTLGTVLGAVAQLGMAWHRAGNTMTIDEATKMEKSSRM